MNKDSDADETIKVFIRIRPNPVNERERESPNKCVESDNNTIIVQPGKNNFTFDKVLNETATQDDVFSIIGITITENCMRGYNSTIFAYGQTGSGKTYTIQGNTTSKYGFDDSERGLAPRILQTLYNLIHKEEQASNGTTKFTVKCSLLEIYNELITDLFMPNSPPLCTLPFSFSPSHHSQIDIKVYEKTAAAVSLSKVQKKLQFPQQKMR